MKPILWLVCAGWLAWPHLAPAQEAPLKQLQQKLLDQWRAVVQPAKGVVGVAALDLATGEFFGLNEQLVFAQASAIKVPLLVEVYRQAQAGKFGLADRRVIGPGDKVAGSGILQALGDSTVQLSVRDLCVLMIALSDNTATNLLIDLVGMDNLNQAMRAGGWPNTRLQRKMIRPEESARGQENISTPAEAVRILQKIHQGTVVSPAACADMLTILQERGKEAGKLKAGLPEGVVVANKDGSLPGVATDWMLVLLPERPYVLVAMENYELDNESATIFPQLARAAHEYFARLGRATKYGVLVDPQLLKH
jgi:beta-lactamase class A